LIQTDLLHLVRCSKIMRSMREKNAWFDAVNFNFLQRISLLELLFFSDSLIATLTR